MMHYESNDKPILPLQVEFNTIASSFASLSTKVSAMHRYMSSRYLTNIVPLVKLPINRALQQIAKGMAQAYNYYKQTYKNEIRGMPVIIMMLVQAGENNAIDQKLLEYELFE